MSLIKCPECKKKISDQCENCPQCGYPIKNISKDKNIEIEKSEMLEAVACTKKPFYKNVWFWIVASVVLAALVLGTVLILNRDTKPKLDGDGNPVFVELTNEVYTNAKEYKGYHINIKGKVFQVMSDNGETKGIQIWLDPDTCEQNVMIYYNTDVEVKQGDYIICSGYIDSVSKYKNAYGATLYAPLVVSSDLKQATYIEVMAPTTTTITPENLKQEKLGYLISVDKVEFSEKETRVYVTATNNGKAKLFLGEVVIVQEGKQYNETNNFEADYTEIPYEIVQGASSSGIIVFPAMDANGFELTIGVHSDNYEENLGELAFVIRKDISIIKETNDLTETIIPSTLKQEKYGYAISIDKVELYKEETLVYLTATNNGNATLCVDTSNAVIVQDGIQYNTKSNPDAGYTEMPCEIIKGAYSSGVITFPAINSNDFELTIDIHSNNHDDGLGPITVAIGRTHSEIKTPWIKEVSIIGRFSNLAEKNTIVFNSDGTVEVYSAFYRNYDTEYAHQYLCGEWTQTKTRGYCSLSDGYTAQEFLISNEGIDGFWGEFYTRRTAKSGSLKNEALEAAKEYRNFNTEMILSVLDLSSHLYAFGFDGEEIEYAQKNAEGFFDIVAEHDYERISMFYTQGYSREAIIDFYLDSFSYEEAKYLVDECLSGRKLTYQYIDDELQLVEHK